MKRKDRNIGRILEVIFDSIEIYDDGRPGRHRMMVASRCIGDDTSISPGHVPRCRVPRKVKDMGSHMICSLLLSCHKQYIVGAFGWNQRKGHKEKMTEEKEVASQHISDYSSVNRAFPAG